MLSISLQIHRNILSAQCFIRYVNDSNSIDSFKVEVHSSGLQLLLLNNEEIVKKVKLITPNGFFILPSPISDSDTSLKSSANVVGRTKCSKAAGQSIGECSFRLQISGATDFDQPEPELKVDVKEYFKERFKSSALWNLFCSKCGVGLPLETVFIERVQEYSESELSEGWFCHGNGPQQSLQPSSKTLYLDDISFYLNITQNLDINHKASAVQNEIGCHCNSDCPKDVCTASLSTDSPDNSHSILSGNNSSDTSTGDACDSKSSEKYIRQIHNSNYSPITNSTHSEENFRFSSFNINRADVKIQNNLDQQIVGNSVSPNSFSSSPKQAESSIKSCIEHTCSDYKHSNTDKSADSNGSKIMNPFVKCQSCGDILTTEKPFRPPFTKFYLDKLMFKNSSVNDDHLEYASKIALLSFWSLVKRSRISSLPAKLFLQSKIHGEDQCLLLWVPSTPLDQFLLRDSIKDILPEINLETELVYKVLYFFGTPISPNIRSWRHDFSVDFYYVSDTMVKTLTKILNASSSYLPEISDARGFKCGFLKAPSESML